MTASFMLLRNENIPQQSFRQLLQKLQFSFERPYSETFSKRTNEHFSMHEEQQNIICFLILVTTTKKIQFT